MEPGIKNGDCNSDIPGRCDVNNFDTLNSVYIKVENDDESELNSDIQLAFSAVEASSANDSISINTGDGFNINSQNDQITNGLSSYVLRGRSISSTSNEEYRMDRDETYQHEYMNANIMTTNTDDLIRTYSGEENMDDHSELNIHTSICDYCNKRVNNLKKHVRIHKVRDVQCQLCWKTFNSNYGLKIHMYVHNTEKQFKCQFCEKLFKQKSYLNKHVKYFHSTGKYTKRFFCPYCAKRFRVRYDLQNHIPIHTGEKPFQCAHCLKYFSKRFALSKHIKYIHLTTLKYFPCDICGKTFKQSCTLKGHKLVHTNKRPFECLQCGKCFKRRSTLNVHIDCVHLKVYNHVICWHCEKQFTRKSLLKRHIERKHL